MKKYFISMIVVVGALAILGGCGNEQDDISQLQNIVEENETGTPERPADINGTVSLVEGNKITVKNEINKEILTEEEQEAKKEQRQNMTQEERQALRSQELTEAETEDEIIELPAGVFMTKGTGTGDGSSEKASFSDLKEGVYVSIWKNGDEIEAVKIKGL